MREPEMLRRSPLWQLTRARVLAFIREPEALFWVFAFPILLALALGVAFRNPGAPRSAVAVLAGHPRTAATLAALRVPGLTVTTLDPGAAELALRRGRIMLFVRFDPEGTPVLAYDPSRPESRPAALAVENALERAAGRRDPLPIGLDTAVRPGGRYIDFLLPGLIGLNLLGTGMWGVGFPIATSRQQKLLKRMIATPMRRSHYLLSFLFARLVWLLLEVGALLLFGWLVFGVVVRGSWLAFTAVTLVGAFAFSALGLLVACRAKTVEAVSGLMNFVMMPMWLLSGTFFAADRFPAAVQPLVQALPLTATNQALRAIVNEGAGLAACAPALALLGAWTLVSFALALRWFRWE